LFPGLASNLDYYLDAQYQQGQTLYCGSATVLNLQPNENRIQDIALIDCGPAP
jgi:hypothetical protein